MFASSDGPPDARRIDQLSVDLVDLLRDADTGTRVLFRLALFAVVWLAPPLAGRPPTFGRLPHADRLRALHRFERSPLGLSLFAVKAMLCIVWFEQAESLAHAGADGRCLVEAS